MILLTQSSTLVCLHLKVTVFYHPYGISIQDLPTIIVDYGFPPGLRGK
jgi:hypothetical protein